MNFSTTYMMTTSMSLLNLSTCSMEMTSYNSEIAFIEIGSINMCNMSDWVPLNRELKISTYFPIYYQRTILSEFCIKIQFSTLRKYTSVTSGALNFIFKWFNILWNCLVTNRHTNSHLASWRLFQHNLRILQHQYTLIHFLTCLYSQDSQTHSKTFWKFKRLLERLFERMF